VSSIYGLYPDADMAQRAVDRLRAGGIPDSDIVVISSEPFEEHDFTRRDHSSAIYRIAAGGGVLGFIFGYWLTSTTQMLWPINTSGMPIVAGFPNAIVIFELTMLGAILATVATLFAGAGLPSWRRRIYDAEVSDGYILVGVENPAAAVLDSLRETLQAVGGRVKQS
jgi:hypothetical protein